MDAKQVVREFHHRAWSAGDLQGARALLADDLVDNDALPFPRRAPGALRRRPVRAAAGVRGSGRGSRATPA